MADAEIAVVLRLVASQFQSEMRKSQGALGEFGKFISDWRVQATAAAGALFVLTKSTADYGEELSKMAQKTGIATDELQGYLYAAKQADVSSESFTQALVHLNKAISENDQSLRSAGIKGQDLNTVLLELNDLFQRLPDGPRKTALAMDLMGKSGASTIPIFNENIRKTSAEFEKLNAKMSPEAIEASNKFNKSLKELDTQLEETARRLGGSMIPFATTLLGLFNDLAKIDWFDLKDKDWEIPLAKGSSLLSGGEKLPPGWALTGKPPEPIIPSSGKEALGPGSDKGVEAFYKHQREQNALFITGANAMEEERQQKLKETLDLQLKNADEAYQGWEREQTKLKENIEEYKNWGAAADTALAKFEEQRQAGLGLYDSLREELKRYATDHERTFNLATDIVRGSMQAMGQASKTFFLDVLKGHVKSGQDVLFGFLDFAQQIVADIAGRMVSAGLIRAAASFFAPNPNANNDLGGTPFALQPIHGQQGAVFTVPGSGGPDSKFMQLFATPGERVSIETPEQQRRGGGGGLSVIVHNYSPAQVQASSRPGNGGPDILELVIRQVDQALSGGSFDRSLSSNFGIRRQGFAR